MACALCSAAAGVQAQALADLWQQALAIDPAITGAQAQLRAAEERVNQAKGAFGPTASVSINSTESRYREEPELALRRFRSEQYALQVTQPLLRNALTPALKSAEEQFEQARAALQQARIEGAQRLVESVFEFFKSRDALRQLAAQRLAVEEQQALARRSFEFGRAAITDVREAEARADLVAAQISAAQQELELRRQIVSELTGQAGATLALADQGLAPEQLPRVEAPSVLDWLAQAQAGSATLQQAQRGLAVADAEVSKAWQGHAPTADVTYNYTRSRDTGTVTSFFPRRGDTSAVGINLNVPLFAGGATQARVREAQAQREKASSDVDAARRAVALGVRQSFAAALSAIGQARGLQAAVASQALALRSQRRGYEVGMKTNAEVLEAQSRLFEVRRDLSRAVYEAWLGYFRLKALSGALEAADIDQLDRLLTPVAHAEPLLDGAHAGSAAMNAPVQARAAAPDEALARALADWRERLGAAGVACRSVAYQADEGAWQQAFEDDTPALQALWAGTRARVAPDNPVALAKADNSPGADLLMAVALRLPSGPPGVLGLLLPPPHSERMVQMVMLSLGGLQLALSAASLAHNERAAQLLEILAYVGSQTQARAAAQEWVNRTAAWARAEAPALAGSLTLALFEVPPGRDALPRLWVAADTAWAEAASPELRQAAELATRALVQAEEVSEGPWWALPVLADGAATAVLVAHQGGLQATSLWPEAALLPLRSSAVLAEPLLRQWHRAERGLPRHALHSTQEAWRKLRGPGHLLWKAGAALAVAVLAVLLLVPVDDRISAHTVIEGGTRQLVTAPFAGFIAQVLVRPGERVQPGQLLARLDDRELKLEQERWLGEREQAAGKLREAMAERDAPRVALAGAELRQAEAQLALVQARLQRTALLAPQAGLVVSGDWAQQLGGPVEAGKEMFEVASTDAYRVVLHVADGDIARVALGQPGVLRLTGLPQQEQAFRVARLSATAAVQEGVNGFRVEAAWVGPVPALTPGMQGVAKVTVGRANLLTVWTRATADWLRLKWWGWWW